MFFQLSFVKDLILHRLEPSTDSLTNIFRVFEIKVVSKTFMPFMAGFENFPSEGSFLAGGLNYDLRPRAFLFPFFPMYCHC